jgi:hypothetical protein
MESPSTTRPASARALQALEESSVFERSTGLLRLLRFLIVASENDPEAMKETYVGTAFYNRDATYDPRYDSIVRVNVMRLRQRLAEYYAGPGANDLVTIEIPRGSYVPLITVKPAPEYKRRAADLVPHPPHRRPTSPPIPTGALPTTLLPARPPALQRASPSPLRRLTPSALRRATPHPVTAGICSSGLFWPLSFSSAPSPSTYC